MPISRNSEQEAISLLAFYEKFLDSGNSQYEEIGSRMMNLVEMIDELFQETQLWGTTSHARLALQTEDKSDANWYIVLSNIGTDEYYIEYLMPGSKQPWENAVVRGSARTLEKFKPYLLIAMRECEAWKDNEELRRLL